MNWKIASLVALSALAGCATGGRSGRIREVQSDSVERCKYLGVVEASDRSGWTMSDDQLGAINLTGIVRGMFQSGGRGGAASMP